VPVEDSMNDILTLQKAETMSKAEDLWPLLLKHIVVYMTIDAVLSATFAVRHFFTLLETQVENYAWISFTILPLEPSQQWSNAMRSEMLPPSVEILSQSAKIHLKALIALEGVTVAHHHINNSTKYIILLLTPGSNADR
jgi:hypothetical protein